MLTTSNTNTRRMTNIPIVVLVVAACMCGFAVPASAQTTLARTVVATGGGQASSATMSIHCTTGEPAVGRVVSTSMEIRAGFWHAANDSSGPICIPDCDQSGTLNIDDFICFQTYFAIGDPAADCDASGALNIDDFICFQTFFALGC